MERVVRSVRACACAIAVCAGLAGAAQAASLESFVFTLGGQADGTGCAKSSAPAPVMAFFGAFGPSVPLPGLEACGLAGGFDSQTAATGPLADERSLSTSWGTGTPNVYVGDTAAVARYGDLEADAHSDYTGISSSSYHKGSEGMAIARDIFTVTSPSVANGEAGSLVLYVTVSGGLSTNGSGTADVEVNYRIASGNFILFRSQASNAINPPFFTSATSTGLDGFSAAPGSLSGSGEVASLPIPIVFGTPFALDLGLLAYTLPGITSVTASSFRATVTGFTLTGPGGVPVPGFTIASASGTAYDANGLVLPAVPVLPGLFAGALAVGLLAWGAPAIRTWARGGFFRRGSPLPAVR